MRTCFDETSSHAVTTLEERRTRHVCTVYVVRQSPDAFTFCTTAIGPPPLGAGLWIGEHEVASAVRHWPQPQLR